MANFDLKVDWVLRHLEHWKGMPLPIELFPDEVMRGVV